MLVTSCVVDENTTMKTS